MTTHVFIVRPFGTKEGTDFDRVERELLRPAIVRLGLIGGTTGEILEQGNIRADMFEQLVSADVVIADVSIDNPNVYYELGVRHALRDRHTILIRSGASSVPFDLRTDRYLRYDETDPARDVDRLVAVVSESMRGEEPDSPVFQLVPGLQAQDPSALTALPMGFQDEVGLAAASGRVGDLELLAGEASSFGWRVEGLAAVGREMFSLNAYEPAVRVWQQVVDAAPDRVDAHLALANMWHRLGQLTRSRQAIEHAAGISGLGDEDLAEIISLRARNAKSRWSGTWFDLDDLAERRRVALESPDLAEAIEGYAEAFALDLNHYYSGFNELALCAIQQALRQLDPSHWLALHDDDEQGVRAGEVLEERVVVSQRMVAASVEASVARSRRTEGRTDIWAALTKAELATVTDVDPARVEVAYRRATATATGFVIDAARRQLALYERLGVFESGTDAATRCLGDAVAVGIEPPDLHVVVGTGHRIDEPGRPVPRFPAEREVAVRKALGEAIDLETDTHGRIDLAISGCASGADLLFLEICEERGIPTQPSLTMDRRSFAARSVAAAGSSWLARFNTIVDRAESTGTLRQLGSTEELPDWLSDRPDYSIWQRANLWMLLNALQVGDSRTMLVAVWDGQVGDGPGGTSHMVSLAQERGARTIVIDPADPGAYG